MSHSVATTPQTDLGRFATAREILRQPAIWRNFAPKVTEIAQQVQVWLQTRAHDEVWFCGAGTSAFIGETLATHLNAAPGPARFRAIPTTDLVACPKNYLRPGLRLLVVSFGRSGNSSESIGTLDLLAKHAPEADRLHITCNGNSALANPEATAPGEVRTIVLPPETDDQGFAMTSSYTTMLLTALACFDRDPPAALPDLFADLAAAAEQILPVAFQPLGPADLPERVVFLGSGPLTGAARESALKVLELTAGQVQTAWDSPLGFRHGPKAIVNATTRVYLLQSGNPHTAAYDRDLADEIRAQFGVDSLVLLGPSQPGVDITIPLIGDSSDAWNAVLYVLVAQVLAVQWSDRLGHNVDDPFAGRNLTRVVAGVTLYDLPTEVLPDARPALVGALDVGGSKIESVLYTAALEPAARRRVAVGKDSYDGLLTAIAAEARWLEEQAGGTALDYGIGLPGLIDPESGRALTANLPATGQPLAADLAARLQRRITVGNDCKCFALSEANGGAGAGFATVFGLILGTGLGGGVVQDGKLVVGLNGLPGEVGHLGIPADLAARYDLPLMACGCGRIGCYETLVSGPGFARLALQLAKREVAPAEIVRLADAGDPEMGQVLQIWLALVAELIHTIQLTIDADCVVLGGGLSNIPKLAARLATAFAGRHLPGVRAPVFATARFGDASGVRGAALLARAAVGV